MKHFISYGFVFVMGLAIGLFFLWKSKDTYKSEQIDIITNGIKNVQKLVVTEATYTEVYNYQDADKYLFETLAFEKKVILFVKARVQVAYDLQKMEIEIDSIYKKVIIKSIPKEELTISPEFKYYDLQQSVWNTFTKDELNTIQQNSIDKLVNTVEISKIKEQARKQLITTLSDLFYVTKLVGWKIEDQTATSILNEDFLKNLKS